MQQFIVISQINLSHRINGFIDSDFGIFFQESFYRMILEKIPKSWAGKLPGTPLLAHFDYSFPKN